MTRVHAEVQFSKGDVYRCFLSTLAVRCYEHLHACVLPLLCNLSTTLVISVISAPLC